MRTAVIFILALCAMVALSPLEATAQSVPQTMAYQGYVTDLAGTPIADGNYNFTFLIYPSEFGGSAIWTESHPNVPVTKGLFNVILGRGTPAMPINISFDTQYFLGIRIGADPELSPRVRLATSAYSFRSRESDAVRDGAITDASVAAGANIAANKLQSTVLTESEIVAGAGVTVNNVAGTLTIASAPVAVTLAGDVAGPAGSNAITNDAVTTTKIADNAVTPAKIAPNIVSSINSVTNDAGNIDIIAGTNITVTPNDAANSITISAAGGGFTLPYSGSVASNSAAIAVSNTGIGDGLQVNASTGYAIDVENNSGSHTAARIVNTNTSNSAYAMYIRSYGTEPTLAVKNWNAGSTALILEGFQNTADSRLKLYNSGELWTYGKLDATFATMRNDLGASATPAMGGYYSDNAVYAWANVYSTGVIASGFGCTTSRTATGTYSITYNRSMSGTGYAPVVSALEMSAPQFAVISAASATGCTVKIWKFASGSFSLVDSQFFFQLVGRP